LLADIRRLVERRVVGPVAGRDPLSWLLAASVAILALVIAAPQLGFASLTGDSVLDTIGGSATVLATAAVLPRSQSRPTRATIALVIALAFRAATMLLLVTAPTLLGITITGLLRDATAVCALIGAALLASAAFAPDEPAPTRATGIALVFLAGAAAAACIGLGAAIHAAWPELELAGDGSAPAGLAQLWHGPLSGVLLGGTTAILLVGAVVGFSIRMRRATAPGLLRWLAVSAMLAAAAQIDYLLTQGRSGATVSLGDLLAGAGMLALAIGVVLEHDHVRRRERESAVAEERRRLARDLHDGVAQELAFIVGQSRQLALAFPNERALAEIGSAAASALDGSRCTIYGLQRSASHTLAGAVEHRARALALRAGLDLEFDVTGDAVAPPELEHGLLSILQEAISNAARHARATRLEVSLGVVAGTVMLGVRDDGSGFAPGRVTFSKDGGFGLLSMSERARELGGALTIESSPGRGTRIVLTVPAGGPRRRAPAHRHAGVMRGRKAGVA
jgi:signal transduction histidine kinase